jgi:hypothetical protein
VAWAGVTWRASVTVSGALLLGWQQGVRASSAAPLATRGRVVATGILALTWAGETPGSGDVFSRFLSRPQYRGETLSGSVVRGKSLSRPMIRGTWMSGY